MLIRFCVQTLGQIKTFSKQIGSLIGLIRDNHHVPRRRYSLLPQLEYLEERRLLSGTTIATTTTISASSNALTDQQQEIITATVSSTAGPPNAGFVTFLDGTTFLGTYSVNNGTAILSTRLVVGLHDISANYYDSTSEFAASSSTIEPSSLINTVAGTGQSSASYNGDNIAATSANLVSPSTCAVDAAGDLFIADTGNSRIQEVNAVTHVITTVVGTGTPGFNGDGIAATAAEIAGPVGLALDAAGDLFFADNGNSRIREVNANTHLISTVAGTGTPGYNGNNIAATAAEIYGPLGIAVDAAGDIFFADNGNNLVREVNATTHLISTIAGTPGAAGYNGDGIAATSAELNNPAGVAVDTAGNVFIADSGSGSDRIREVNATTHLISTVAGTGGPGYSQDGVAATTAALNDPNGIAVDAAGNLFIADSWNGWVREVNATTHLISTVAGVRVTTLGQRATSTIGDGGPAIQAGLIIPTSVAIDASGNLYISDYADNRIREVTNGIPVDVTPGAPMVNLLDPSGPYTGNPFSASANVLAIGNLPVDGSTTFTYYSGNTVNGPGTATAPTNVGTYTVVGAFTSSDPNFANTTSAPLTFSITPAVTTTSVSATLLSAGFGQSETLTATVSSAAGIPNAGTVTLMTGALQLGTAPVINGQAAFNTTALPAGTHIITASYSGDGANFGADNSTIQASAVINTVAGNGAYGYDGDGSAATSAQVNGPDSVALDAAGDLFIADALNNRVREINATTHLISTVAGTGTAGFNGDGITATSAELFDPTNVFVDAAGNLFISDTGNERVREINATTHLISTIAGTGVQGYNGDGIAATTAELSNPLGITVDSSGNVFIADTQNNRVREVNSVTHKISTVAGTGTAYYWGDGGPATAAFLNHPTDVVLDAAGDLFIADAMNNEIREVNATTQYITTVAGNYSTSHQGDGVAATATQLNYPVAIAVDAAGDIFIADTNDSRVREVNAVTQLITTIAGSSTYGDDGGGNGVAATATGLASPTGVAVDAAGNVYIADTQDNQVREVNASTQLINTVAGTGNESYNGDGIAATSAEVRPNSVAVDALGDIFIADPISHMVREVNATTHLISTVAGTGIAGYNGDGIAATAAELDAPIGVALDSAGDIFIADQNFRIREVNAVTHLISTVAGVGYNAGNNLDGAPASQANLFSLGGIAVDNAGDLFFSAADQVVEINATTQLMTVIAGAVGGGGIYSNGPQLATNAHLDTPEGIAFDAAGNIDIADTGDDAIREVNLTTQLITTVAGGVGEGYNGDGIPATSASLNVPLSVAVDAAGDIFISDYNNDRIREVSAVTHLISTVAGINQAGYNGDGIPGTSAELYHPNGIALDTSGNLYIADTNNSRVRELTNGLSLNVTQATPSVVAVDPTGSYTGNPFTATATATGIGSTTVNGNATFTYYTGSTVNGTGTTIAPTALGTYTVVAAFTSTDPNYGNAVSKPLTFTINVGPAAKLAYQVIGNSGTASGYLPTIKVAVEDQFGNVVMGNTSTVTVSVASGPGTFANGSVTSVTAVNGVATFSGLILRTAGTYLLTASDGTLAVATSGNIVVSPGVAAKLAIGNTQGLPASSTVTAGTVITPTVLVEDNYGNVVSDNSTQVSLTFGGVNLGTQTVVNGVATFAPQTLSVTGTKNVNASVVSSSSSLSNAVTVAFVVTPAAAAKLVITQSPISGSAGNTLGALKVAVEDQYGNLLTGNTSTVTLSVAGGPGSLTAGSTTSVAAVNGIATFSNLTLNTSGVYTLSVSDGTLAGATTTNVVISPSTAAKLAFLVVPVTGITGTALSPSLTLAVEDQFGNLVTNNSSAITLSVATGPAGFAAGSKLTVNAVGGIATFANLMLNTVGTYTLTATDGALTKSTSQTLVVTGPPAKLVIQTTPGSGIAGQALSPSMTVLVEDQFGNLVTSAASTVTLSVASGPGAFNAASTISVAAVNGIATFSNLILDTSGTYTLGAGDGALSGTISGNVVISAASATQVVFQSVPSSGGAGLALPSVIAAIEDQFGNVATTDSSTVTIVVASGPGGFANGSTTSVAAVNGIATFNNLILNKTGTYTLSAADGTLAGATSSNISVVIAPAKLAFKVVPATGNAGSALASSLTVDALDPFGNIVTTDNSTVTLTVASGPGGFANSSTVSVTAVNGIATFSNLVFNTAGTYTLSASDATLTGATSSNVVISHAAAAKVAFQSANGGKASGYLSAVTVAVEDQFGNVVTGNTSTVALAVASGPGGFANGSVTSVTAINGIATFSSLILRMAGTYTLSATDGTLVGATSGNVTVTPGVATKLVIGDPQALPASTTVTAGTVITPVVLVEDNYGNVVSDNSTQVFLTFGGVNLGTQTVINGVATFAAQTLSVVATKNVNASVVSSGASLSNATTVAFVVVPAAAAKLVVTQSPATGTAGTVLGLVKVAVEDQYGNILTGNTSTVTLAVGTGPGTLTAGSTTSVVAINGVATFNNLVLNTSGTYTLSASEVPLTGAASATLVVSPSTATKLAFQSVPVGGSVGTALAPSVKVAVEDQYGNVVTGNTSTVTMAVGSGPGSLTSGSTISVAAVNGIATFSNLIMNTSGSDTLSASDGTLTKSISANIPVSGPATKLVFQTVPGTGTAGQALSSLTVLVEDQSGNLVTGNSSTVTLSVASGPGAFDAASTISVAAVNGIATFTNLILDTSGTYTLSSSDGPLSGSTSGNVTINAGSPAKVAFQTVPGSGGAGLALPAVTVAVEDQFGNLVTSDSSTVTIAVASGPGGFASGSTTSVAAVNGSATFNNLILNKTGTYTLSVADGTLAGATSASLSVVVAPAKLTFKVATATGIAGTSATSLTVAVLDPFGNVVTSDNSTVTLTVATGPGSFATGSMVSVTAVNGIATFSNLIFNTAGTYTLSASDGALAGATSSSVVITHAAAAKVAFQAATGGVASGYLSAVKVAVEDQFGNVVTGNTSTVALAVASGPGGFANGSVTSVAAVNGIATFSSLILRTAGTYTLSATDGTLVGTTSGNVVVTPGVATKLVIGDPLPLPASTTVTAGTVITPVVLVEDNYGNVVSDNSTQVSLTFGGVNLGTQTVVNGVATFAAQTLTVVSTKNVNASVISSGLTLSNATTVAFVVTAKP